MTKTMTLDCVLPNFTYTITKCNLSKEDKLRFFEMGLTIGAKVRLKKVAPLGDPLQFEVRGYDVCIRLKQAKEFEVKKL